MSSSPKKYDLCCEGPDETCNYDQSSCKTCVNNEWIKWMKIVLVNVDKYVFFPPLTWKDMLLNKNAVNLLNFL